jgi:hypothetical protein
MPTTVIKKGVVGGEAFDKRVLVQSRDYYRQTVKYLPKPKEQAFKVVTTKAPSKAIDIGSGGQVLKQAQKTVQVSASPMVAKQITALKTESLAAAKLGVSMLGAKTIVVPAALKLETKAVSLKPISKIDMSVSQKQVSVLGTRLQPKQVSMQLPKITTQVRQDVRQAVMPQMSLHVTPVSKTTSLSAVGVSQVLDTPSMPKVDAPLVPAPTPPTVTPPTTFPTPPSSPWPIVPGLPVLGGGRGGGFRFPKGKWSRVLTNPFKTPKEAMSMFMNTKSKTKKKRRRRK